MASPLHELPTMKRDDFASITSEELITVAGGNTRPTRPRPPRQPKPDRDGFTTGGTVPDDKDDFTTGGSF